MYLTENFEAQKIKEYADEGYSLDECENYAGIVSEINNQNCVGFLPLEVGYANSLADKLQSDSIVEGPFFAPAFR